MSLTTILDWYGTLTPGAKAKLSLHDLHRLAKALGEADVARLVVAARIVAFEDQSPDALRELDQASEAFADRVPWDSEPATLSPAPPITAGNGMASRELAPSGGALANTETPEHADESEGCSTCQGNGEVVTDWERYLHAHEGDIGDEAVATCPDCDGQGAAPQPDPLTVPDSCSERGHAGRGRGVTKVSTR